jgi:hypothetical protein
MTHKIAIITNSTHCYDRYGDDYQRVVDSITDWTVVTHEEYTCLKAMENKLDYHLIEQPVNTGAFVAKTVADYLAYAKAEEIRQKEAKAKREATAMARKHKKDLKDKESKLALLKKLQEELGEEAKV